MDDGYSLTFAILKDKPEYLPLIKQCLELQKEAYKEPIGGWGFETTDAQIISLADTGLLFANIWRNEGEKGGGEFRFLKNHPRYLLHDMLGVKQALHDIENKQILLSDQDKSNESIPLSETTRNKLRDYITGEKLQNWPKAEEAVIERAVNEFLRAHEKKEVIYDEGDHIAQKSDGLLPDYYMTDLYSFDSEGNIHIPLLNTLRHEIYRRVCRLKEKINRKSKYLSYSNTDNNSAICYLHCYCCDEIVIDINIEKALGDELSRMGFDIRPRKSYRTRENWVSGWHVPYGMLADNSKRDTIINYIERAFTMSRIRANLKS